MRKQYATPYWRYLQRAQPGLGEGALWQARRLLEQTRWEAPSSGVDWNNLGVLLLAQASASPEQAAALIPRALDALTRAAHLGHPLARAHQSCAELLTQGPPASLDVPLARLAFDLADPAPADPGLVFLPPVTQAARDPRRFEALLAAGDGRIQALRAHAAALEGARPFLLDPVARRARRLELELGDAPATLWLAEGIADCAAGRWEGQRALQRAAQLDPRDPAPLHALSLAARALGRPEIAADLRRRALELGDGGDPRVAFAHAGGEETFTWIPFDDGLLAAPPALTNLSTALLLAQGDWFEGDLRLWRRLLRPGMTVVDVGASVGVYALSAARRVGPSGRVVALEAGAGSASLLRRSQERGGWGTLRVIEAAASNAGGQGWLSGDAPELARVSRHPVQGGARVRCQTLDAVAAEEGLERVDLLKIDVEGHELAVLQGALEVLDASRPVILYENLRPGGWNQGAAIFLRTRGYTLYHYNPHLARLSPVEGSAPSALNLWALPPGRDPASLGAR